MIFKIRETVESLPNRVEAIQYIANKVNAFLAEPGYTFSYMVIDGEPVYEEPLIYLENRIQAIQEVEVVVKTDSEYVAQLIFELKNILFQAIPQIKDLGKIFIHNNNQDIWEELESFLREMGIFIQIYNEIAVRSHILVNDFSFTPWKDIENKFNLFTGGLAGLSTFVENKDTVIIADLLLYEIVPALERIHGLASGFVENGGVNQ